MSAGAGLYELSIFTTIIGMLGLVTFHSIEKILPNDSYRILEITTSNNDNITAIINSVKTEKIKILHLDKERNYKENVMIFKFSIKLFHRGLTDKISHNIVKKIEQLESGVYKIKWHHL